MMRKGIALFLALSLSVVSGLQPVMAVQDDTEELIELEETIPQFDSLGDPNLLQYVEDTVYTELESELQGENYTVENVETVYISKEYLEEVAYNSKANIWFGYTIDELLEAFDGTPYVFTLGKSGATEVVPFVDYDDTYDRVIRNIAIGTGVILVCVTVSVISGGMGAAAVSMVFAASARTATEFALFSGVISAAITAAITGYNTGDFEQALKAALLQGSESFKWGAITGAATGGALELQMIRIASSGGLTMNEAAMIMKEHDLPAQFVKQIHSMKEYNELLHAAEEGGLTIETMAEICMSTKYPLELVKLFKSTEEGAIYYEQAGLTLETVNGQMALVRTIDLSYESELAGRTVTNLERMRLGYAAIDPLTGEAYELHHIGQSISSPLAILTHAEHMSGGNNVILHNPNIGSGNGVHSIMSDSAWAAQREAFWKAFAEVFG